MTKKYYLITGFLIACLLYINIFLTQEPERPHRHKLVFDKTIGINNYYVTYCYDTKMQVDAHGNHFESERSINYFNLR